MAAQRASFASDDYAPSTDPQAHNRDVFGDEFASSEYADSIHTVESRRENPFSDPVDTVAPTRDYSVDTFHSQNRVPTNIQSRNSIRKSSQEASNIRSATSQNPSFATQNPEPPTRPLSFVSTTSFAAPQSPTTTDQSGPSHPYAMYPQNFPVSRSASNATARSLQPTSSSSSRPGPRHPYNLYPQTVSSESSGEGSHQSSIVPIGFPGHNTQFTRRLGPEGEEQDIVGPHGHTEQLPPYTRYPDTYDNKAAAVGLLSATGEPADGERAPHTPVEMQERRPTEEDATTPAATTPVENARNNFSPDPVVPVSEKAWKEKTWKEKRKTKLWGPLSVGAVLLTVGVIVIIAVICGGVIGGVLGRHKKPPKDGANIPTNDGASSHTPVQVTVTKYIDATPVATPTSAGVLPTGTYQVEFYNATGSSSTCLTDASQQAAWSCAFPQTQTDMIVDVYFSNGKPYASLYNLDPYIDYGAQPPQLRYEALAPVKDLDNTSYGVAYQFQSYYTKLVVLPQSALVESSNEKREAQVSGPWPPPPPPWWSTRKRVNNGDVPWFCFFNNTFIEGFLYLDEELMESSSSTYFAPSAVSSSASEATDSTAYTSGNPYTTQCPTCGLQSSTTEATSSPTPTTSTSPSTTSPQSGVVQTAKVKRTSVATSYASSSSSTSGASATMSPYPRLMKLEERRVSMATTEAPAICTKMSKGSDHSFTVVTAGNNSPITIVLTESDPSAVVYGDTRKRGAVLRERQEQEGGCFCQWCT